MNGRLSGAFRETAVPITYVIDRTSRVVMKIRGELSDAVIASRVVPAIEAAHQGSGTRTS